MSFLFTEKCISKILPLRLCYALQPKLARFFIFHGYFLEDSNVVFWFFAFTIINKNNFTCKQRFGFNENVKQKKSLKVCSQPLMGMVIVLLIKMVARNEISVTRRKQKGKSWGMLHEVLYKCLSHFNFVQVYRNILACYITTKLTCRLPNWPKFLYWPTSNVTTHHAT